VHLRRSLGPRRFFGFFAIPEISLSPLTVLFYVMEWKTHES